MSVQKRRGAKRCVLLLCGAIGLLGLVGVYLSLTERETREPRDWHVSAAHKKQVHQHVYRVLEGQCNPSKTRQSLLTQLPPASHMTQPFLWKDVPLSEDLFLYAPPFGFRGLQDEVEELLKKISVSPAVIFPVKLPAPGSVPPLGVASDKCQRCVVVGNGGVLKGLELGPLIDRFDTIIRLNSGPLGEFSVDVGNRTSIRMSYPEGTALHWVDTDPQTLFVAVVYKGVDISWTSAMINKLSVSLWDWLFFWQKVPDQIPLEPHKFRLLNPHVIRETALNLLKYHPPKKRLWGWEQTIPTIGVSALDLASLLCDEVSLVGFGYNLSQKGAPLHYYDHQPMSAMLHKTTHNVNKETELLKALVLEGAITDLTVTSELLKVRKASEEQGSPAVPLSHNKHHACVFSGLWQECASRHSCACKEMSGSSWPESHHTHLPTTNTPAFLTSSTMFNHEFFQKLTLPDLNDVSQYISSVSTPLLFSIGAVTAATTYYLATRPKAIPFIYDLQMQSVEVSGVVSARRSVLLDGDDQLTHTYEDARTMYEFFLRGLRVSSNGPFLGSRKPKQPYEWMSYEEVKERAENLGSAFLHKGHSRTSDSHIGIFSQNRPEWNVTELACYTYSLVAVPLYDTLGLQAIQYIVDKASIKTVVCDVDDKVTLLLDCIKDKKHTLKTIVVMETPDAGLVSRGQEAGIHILSLQEMEAIGKAHHHQPMPPQPGDMAIICFTSGTTGNPKGAMLTHGNIVCNCSAFIKLTKVRCPLGVSDVHISFLPLAHMFERVVQGVMVVQGARIGFFQGDIRLLSDDLKMLKPTMFPVVPRLLNRMYDKIYGQANSPLKRWLLEFAYKRKEAELIKGIVRRDSIWDYLIFRKIQASLGGCVRILLTGAAPVSPTVLRFLRVALSCECYEGYGQTECTAGVTMTTPGDWTAGHVGAPLPCNMVKMVDVPEMNYLAVNGEGEVCAKGHNVFKGYLKDPENTANALDADGWVHTGDVGKWLPNGTLKIIDRKKHIFKLAQGEYIAPEKIENIYTSSEAVAQIFVHGDSLQACVVAVVVPDPDVLSDWAKRTLGLDGSYQELCGREEVKEAILEDMQKLGKERGLKSFEQVKAICIQTEPFSVQNGLLTPTLKSKRNEMRLHFSAQIAELYAAIIKV
ncbi:long-chain-fatty-acid--CoA ligase 1-like isoform X3 [Antennarius striatus]